MALLIEKGVDVHATTKVSVRARAGAVGIGREAARRWRRDEAGGCAAGSCAVCDRLTPLSTEPLIPLSSSLLIP